MRWNSRFANRSFLSICLTAMGTALAGSPAPAKISMQAGAAMPMLSQSESVKSTLPVEMSFMKGDTRNGSKVHLRVVGDSLYYRQITYSPNTAPLESRKSILLYGQRRRALKGVMGELPRYPAFGSCYGRDMRFYMVETAEGKFYRSLPERGGKCYMNEPGIWSLFQDLDDLMAPPTELDYQEYSAS